MNEIDYHISYNEDETEKIFEDWALSTSRDQTRDWLDIVWLAIGGGLWYFTNEPLYFVLFLIHTCLSFQLKSIHRRQTRIAKYLMHINNKLK